MGRRVLKFDGLSGRGLWWRLRRRLQKRGRGWRRRLCRRVASLRSGGNSGFAAEGGGSALRAQIIKKPAPIPVISTAAGQPPIGKPLIVQARGQLRLTWRLYAESPQSGEISPSDGTGGITAGDLQAQSIIGAICIYPHTGTSPRSR